LGRERGKEEKSTVLYYTATSIKSNTEARLSPHCGEEEEEKEKEKGVGIIDSVIMT
jgi:hypothetical protein